WTAAPLVNGRRLDGAQASVRSPAHPELVVGHVIEASAQQASAAAAVAHEAQRAWAATRAEERAARLERLAGLMEEHLHELMALCVWEAGKTLPDALADVREAVDFCRYYAQQARGLSTCELKSPVGET